MSTKFGPETLALLYQLTSPKSRDLFQTASDPVLGPKDEAAMLKFLAEQGIKSPETIAEILFDFTVLLAISQNNLAKSILELEQRDAELSTALAASSFLPGISTRRAD